VSLLLGAPYILLAAQLLRSLVDERRVQRRFAADPLQHSDDHLLLGGILEHVAGGACLKFLEQVIRVLVYGCYNDAGDGKLPFDRPGCLKLSPELGYLYR
jgi:hypothetical protein